MAKLATRLHKLLSDPRTRAAKFVVVRSVSRTVVVVPNGQHVRGVHSPGKRSHGTLIDADLRPVHIVATCGGQFSLQRLCTAGLFFYIDGDT